MEPFTNWEIESKIIQKRRRGKRNRFKQLKCIEIGKWDDEKENPNIRFDSNFYCIKCLTLHVFRLMFPYRKCSANIIFIWLNEMIFNYCSFFLLFDKFNLLLMEGLWHDIVNIKLIKLLLIVCRFFIHNFNSNYELIWLRLDICYISVILMKTEKMGTFQNHTQCIGTRLSWMLNMRHVTSKSWQFNFWYDWIVQSCCFFLADCIDFIVAFFFLFFLHLILKNAIS